MPYHYAKLKEFEDAADLTGRLTDRIKNLLGDGIGKRGRAGLVVSGGTTPVPLFEALSGTDLKWEKVFITLADERWVDPDHRHSNENLVRTHLLKNKAAGARFIGLKTPAAIAGEGEKECMQRLKQMPVPFDVLILGMGGDGHTASLFPGAASLSAALDRTSGRICMAIVPRVVSLDRMTLTLPAILNSRQIFVHITGEEKRRVYEKALAEGPLEAMPIRAILGQEAVPVTVYWAP